jgi:hypothetical protein
VTTVTDDLRERFYIAEEQYREDIARLLKPLSDEELEDLLALFHFDRLREVPLRYHGIAYRVRAHISQEKKKRAAAAAQTGAVEA